jgi:hypothetical protein
MGAVALALVIAIGRVGRYESATGKPARQAVAPVVDTTPRDTTRPDSLPPAAATPPQQKPPSPRPQPPAQQRPAPEQQQPRPPQPAPPPPAAPVTQPAPPTGNQEQRYALVFVNVRRSPSRGSTTVAVLNPGDAVLVDSLRRGWYRVIRDGRVLGYADRRYLSTTPR